MKDNGDTDAITRLALRAYSRRGAFALLGKLGLTVAGVTAGVGLPESSEACNPEVECYGSCYACCSSCIFGTTQCTCTCTGCDCTEQCFQAHGYYSNLCAPLCNCPSCGSVCLPGSC